MMPQTHRPFPQLICNGGEKNWVSNEINSLANMYEIIAITKSINKSINQTQENLLELYKILRTNRTAMNDIFFI